MKVEVVRRRWARRGVKFEGSSGSSSAEGDWRVVRCWDWFSVWITKRWKSSVAPFVAATSRLRGPRAVRRVVEVERRERSSDVVVVRLCSSVCWRVFRAANGRGRSGSVWRMWL